MSNNQPKITCITGKPFGITSLLSNTINNLLITAFEDKNIHIINGLEPLLHFYRQYMETENVGPQGSLENLQQLWKLFQFTCKINGAQQKYIAKQIETCDHGQNNDVIIIITNIYSNDMLQWIEEKYGATTVQINETNDQYRFHFLNTFTADPENPILIDWFEENVEEYTNDKETNETPTHYKVEYTEKATTSLKIIMNILKI